MKALKYILSTFLVLAMVISCDKDQFEDLDFVGTAVAPTNVSAQFKVTQDNTGLVSIAPTADGGVTFDVYYGDATAEPAKVTAGAVTTHTYAEGSYSVKIVANGITGLKTEATKDLVVSFQPPAYGSDPIVENDLIKTKQVNVTVPGDTEFAINFDVHFVEDGIETILTANVGETVSYTYANPGLVDIKIVLKGAAIATTEFLVTDFEVTEILAPVESATAPLFRDEADYISIFSDEYNDIPGTDFNPFWWQETIYSEYDLNGDKMIQYANLNYQGIQIGETIDVSSMEYLHIDIWTPGLAEVKVFPLPVGVAPQDERFVTLQLTADEWNSFDIPMSDFTDQGLPVDNIHQFKFEGADSGTIFIDNLYFWKAPSEVSVVAGTWKLAPEAGALKVGPGPDDGSWWQTDAQAVIDRACFFDDEYVFNEDGSFQNILGAETWIEPWQGMDPEGCGTPVAPHDGTADASYSYNEEAGLLTINGKGAYIGLPKAHDGGEISNPADAPNSITYEVIMAEDKMSMKVMANLGWGYWTYKLVREVSPVVGTWKLAPEAGALKVGPAPNDGSWWQTDEQAVIDRACYFDDLYVFSFDGSFQNVLGDETWIEPWQGMDPEGCGTPVAPHDGQTPAVFVYDENASTLTLHGKGAFIGLPKAFNGGEIGNPADAPNSITYEIFDMPDDNTMIVMANLGWGYWTYKLVKN